MTAETGRPAPSPTSPSIVLLTLAHLVESELGAALAPLGLTISRLGLLGHIASMPGASFSDLARMSRVTVQSVHTAVKAMAGAGLVRDTTAPVAAGVPVGASAPPAGERSAERSRAVAVALHRITRVYGIFGVIVPVAGIALGSVQGRMGEIWINIAMVLTALAGALLAFLIYPGQRDALAQPPAGRGDDGSRLRRLAMLAGVYNLLWAVVVVLMIVRPGEYPSP